MCIRDRCRFAVSIFNVHNQPSAFRFLFRESFPEQVGIVAFPLFPVPIPRSLKVRENMLSDALLSKGVRHSGFGYGLPMGLMALRHRGKTATLAASPRVPPWWCQTVGLGIGCTSRLPSSQ